MIRKATDKRNVWANTFEKGIVIGVRDSWLGSLDSPAHDYSIASIECMNGKMVLVINKELVEHFGIELMIGIL